MSYLSLIILSLLIISQISSSSSSSSSDSSIIRLPSEELCPNNNSVGSCPVNCFKPDPVCGENGVTYWCGCPDAHCAGVRVVKSGYCDVGNGGSGSVSGQALLLVHLVWLIVLGFSLLCGLL